ncbi:MAG: DUF5103 domain-containing protein [Flavobacteriia bacterium]|nr:MAG: DUF5103 domain-containing protein [Flavobacteriia bacterium]
MYIIKSCIFLFFLFLLPVFAQGQQIEEVIPPLYIKSVVLNPHKVNKYVPLIRLGDSFSLSFDDLNGDQKYYSYKIEHCNYNWESSGLSVSEYLSGFQTDRIRDYEDSFNTFQNYTHYRITIPNKNMKIKKTGNYIISVLDEDNSVLFTRRVIIYQSRTNVEVSVHRSRDISYIDQKQDIEFVVFTNNLNLRDPMQDIKVAVYQNMDWNTVRTDIPPKYITNGKLLYNYVSDISFWAGNEFLYFDSKEIRNATNNIAKTRLDEIFNTYLYIDEERYNKAYSFYPDINGYFVLRTIDTDNISIEGDYSMVHFKLDTKQTIIDKNIYVYGAYNDWKLTDENKMIFNENTRLYEAAIPFKQGFYNYTYVTSDSSGEVDNHQIEGSFYQTENEYTVIVYLKQFGDRYTQVIGIGSANSRELQN